MLKPSALIAFLACLTITTSALAGDTDLQVTLGEGDARTLTVDIDDDVSQEVVRKMLSVYQPDQLKACAADAKPGEAQLDVHIKADGSVERVEPTSDSIKHGVVTCVSDPLEGADFGESDATRSVTVRLAVTKTADGGAGSSTGSANATRSSRQQGFGRIGGVARKPVEGPMKIVLVSVDGPLDEEAVKEALDKKSRILRDCYERELRAKPDLAGDVTAEVEVTKEGRNKTATIEASTVESSKVSGCVMRTMTRMRFGTPDAATTITVKFEYRNDKRD